MLGRGRMTKMNRPLAIAYFAGIVLILVAKQKIMKRLFPRRNDLPLRPDHDAGTIGCLLVLCLWLICAIMLVALAVVVILRHHNH